MLKLRSCTYAHSVYTAMFPGCQTQSNDSTLSFTSHSAASFVVLVTIPSLMPRLLTHERRNSSHCRPGRVTALRRKGLPSPPRPYHRAPASMAVHPTPPGGLSMPKATPVVTPRLPLIELHSPGPSFNAQSAHNPVFISAQHPGQYLNQLQSTLCPYAPPSH